MLKHLFENRILALIGPPVVTEFELEAQKLTSPRRETATDLMEHAALLIAKSVELEKLILARGNPEPSKTR